MSASHRRTLRLLDRVILGALILLALVLLGIQAAQAGEIVPSVGLTRTVDGDAKTRTIYGLAFRGALAPVVKSEIGLGYRSESIADDDLEVRMWPVTASLWLTPAPTLYAGGGLGWYHTTYDYRGTLPFEDRTTQDFGLHVGGGLAVPLGPRVALDLHGRYVFLQEQENPALPASFDPDFWTTSVGLAIQF